MAGDATISFEEFKSNLEAVFNSVIHEHEPVSIKNGDGETAVLMPAGGVEVGYKPRVKTKEDHERLMSSFGSWSDVDIDTFLEENRKSRDFSSRPPVEL